MTKQKTLWGLSALMAVILMTGCKNNNLFGGLHDEGSGDAESLVVDGNAALADKNYAKANDYFEKALAQDSRNAEALYGQAAAAMGLSGLSVGQLVANLTQNGGGSSLQGAVRTATLPSLQVHTANPDSLLYNINPGRLDDALNVVIVNLETIRMGHSDGKISPNDTSLLINLGVARLLKAVSEPLKKDLIDILEVSGEYTIEKIKNPLVALDGDCLVVDRSVLNVGWGYLNLEAAALKLNLVSGSTLDKVKVDVNDLYEKYGDEVSPCTPTSQFPPPPPAAPTDGIDPLDLP
ncbi:MAG: hypothetical protein KBD85_04235 [Elusimicrobia bacterium]|nr:hypothetical protein [Elusimicrobiota bacterium]MBP9127949.1 hypothetical protein [Elusimicrobiota bacterium]MBP9699209.1 hypothetical protein [Elusimicrobiota bacterium]